MTSSLTLLLVLTTQLPAGEVSQPGQGAAAVTPPGKVVLVPTVGTAERVPLPKLRGSLQLRVDPLSRSIEIVAPRDLGAVAAKVASGLGDVCPRWEVAADRVVLRCRTPRLQAAVVEQGGRRFVDIQELRGLPRQGEDHQLDLFYDPERAGLGGPCPGTSAVGRGECALRDGNLSVAELQFKVGLASGDRALAALRLGDLAIRRGDFNGAALAWDQAGTVGPFGRLAAARLCELRGNCLDRTVNPVFDGGELPEPMRTELALRAARVDAFEGRLPQVLARLSEAIRRGERGGGGCVSVGRRFCRRLILWALQEPAADGGKAALELYLSLPDRTSGPHDVALASAAAERAAALGAPRFGGNLLASVAGSVPASDLAPHLLRSAELYLDGRDPAHAQVMLDYADSRLAPRQVAGARWAKVRKRLQEPMPERGPRDQEERLAREILSTEAARDLARALTALARSRSALP